MTSMNRWSAASLLVLPLVLLAACGSSSSTTPGDTTGPTVAITDNVPGATATGNVTFTFTFSEDVGTSFALSDITLTGGTKGTMTKVSATVATLVAIPTAAAAGTLTVTVAAGAFSDLAGNVNASAATASQAYDTRVADTTPPTVAITDNVPGATATGDVTFTFTFSEDVGTSFTASDVTVTGGTKGAFATVSATVSTLVVSPTAASTGTISVTVPVGSFSDLAGNNNAVAATATQDYNTNTALTQMDLPVTFDSATVNYALAGFGGAEDSSVVADPAGGANKVVKVIKSATAATWGGTSLTPPANGTPKGFATRIPLDATHTRMTVRTWSPDVGAHVRLKVEDKTNPTISVETEALTTVANAWETLTFDFLVPTVPPTAGFNAANTYDLATIFFNFGTDGATAGAKTYYFDDMAWVSTANGGGGNPGTGAKQVVFADDYAAGVSFAGFGGATNAVSVDATVSHSGTSSLRAAVPAAGYTGGALKAATPQDLTAFNCVTYWVKSDKDVTLNVTGIGDDAVGGPSFKAESLRIPVTATWTKHIIPIPVPAKLNGNMGLFHFAEGSEEGAYTLWFDDVQYENISDAELGAATGASVGWPAVTVGVGATFKMVPGPNTVNWSGLANGNAGNLTDVSFRYFALTSSNTGVATVDADGVITGVAAGTANITGKLGTITVAGQAPVTVTAPVPPLAVPATIAAAPTAAAANVISMFSSSYTNVGVDSWSTDWSSCCNAITDPFDIGGHAVKKYDLHHFVGIQFVGVNAINATAMNFFHLDVWTPNGTEFQVRLVNNVGPTQTESTVIYNAGTTPAITKEGWISLDIPLSSFSTLAGTNALGQMLLLVPGGTNAVFYVDNVYFHK